MKYFLKVSCICFLKQNKQHKWSCDLFSFINTYIPNKIIIIESIEYKIEWALTDN